jgi:hypothetical protein
MNRTEYFFLFYLLSNSILFTLAIIIYLFLRGMEMWEILYDFPSMIALALVVNVVMSTVLAYYSDKNRSNRQ